LLRRLDGEGGNYHPALAGYFLLNEGNYNASRPLWQGSKLSGSQEYSREQKSPPAVEAVWNQKEALARESLHARIDIEQEQPEENDHDGCE